MRRSAVLMIGAIVGLAAVTICVMQWQRNKPRRIGLQTLENLNTALSEGDGQAVYRLLALPLAQSGRTPEEQSEFVTQALRDEVSPEGIRALRRHAVFGPLLEIFPAEGAKWASQAGVDPAACLAFRAENNGIQAAVVLVRDDASHRVVRLDNVKQLADPITP